MKSKAAQVAETIRDQIGQQALTMIGAKDLTSHEDNATGRVDLTFKVCAAGALRYIKVTLEPSDLYTVEFFKLTRRGYNRISLSQAGGVYAADLARIIGTLTGLAVSL